MGRLSVYWLIVQGRPCKRLFHSIFMTVAWSVLYLMFIWTRLVRSAWYERCRGFLDRPSAEIITDVRRNLVLVNSAVPFLWHLRSIF